MRRKTQDICFNGVMRLLITTEYLARDTGIWEWVSEGEDKTFHKLNSETLNFHSFQFSEPLCFIFLCFCT